MAYALSFFGSLCLAFVAWLTIDGLRAVFARRRVEKARQALRLRVLERREVADSLLCLRLALPDGGILPTFAAGQHLLLKAPAGAGDKTIQRAYSIAAWETNPRTYELGIKREAQGAMTQWLWSHLQAGDTIETSRPQGHFTLPKSPSPLVLIGGGIGITPMRAMLHEALAQRREVTLFHAARTREQLLYAEEFSSLAASQPGFRYHPILSRPDDTWQGMRGRLNAPAILHAANMTREAEYCLCAADAMMEALRADLAAAGIAAERIHWEAFGVAATPGAAGLPIKVSMRGAAREFSSAGAPTLLAELEAQDIALASECRAGSCGQCLLSLDDGEVDWLTQPELEVPPGKILPCVCSPRTPLALSLR